MHSKQKSTELRIEFVLSRLSPSLFPLHHNPQIKSDEPLKSVPCYRLFFCEIIGEATKKEELSPTLSSVGDRAAEMCVSFSVLKSENVPTQADLQMQLFS